MFSTALALAVGLTGSPVAVGVSRPPVLQGTLGPVLPASTAVHLGVSLRAPSLEAMRARAMAQQDPLSPSFRQWLTPLEFGQSFGLSDADYGRVQSWLVAAGFNVTAFDDHLFMEGYGTHAMVQKLLGVQLHALSTADGNTYRTFQGTPQAPGDIATLLLNISGLDTQRRFHPRVVDTQGDRTFGPQDLRRFYDLQPLLDLGYTGRGAQLVVLGVATDKIHAPRSGDIQFFFDSYADTNATFLTRTPPNPNQDVDTDDAARAEMELDVEVQAIAAPGATSITLELSPASEQLSTGAHDVATLPNVTAVSTSFGTCEAATSSGEAQSVEQLVLLGTLAGQTWVAAAGDRGADDCGTGTSASVDLPADVPEIVAAGGTALKNAAFDADSAIAGYQQEVTWNQAASGAGGGGRSALFSKPVWQVGITPADGARDLPDLALLASPVPGIAVDTQRIARTSPAGGTSVAAPLAAGIFALLSDRLGCRLGGVNPALYAVGLAQLDGGLFVFHDVVAGDNGFNSVMGENAGAGFDLATGWGSLDVQGLAAALPACPFDAGMPDAGPLVPYDSCSEIGCPPGSTCETEPEGPSSCVTPCDPLDGGSCGSGSVCVAVDGGGQCAPGCLSDDDCPEGDACEPCTQSCQPAGNGSARIGDACQQDSDCAAGGMCLTDGTFAQGYCTRYCDSCACPSGASCAALNVEVCLAGCQVNADCREGYACQPLATGSDTMVGVCLPHCQSDADCEGLDPGTVCNLQSGACGTPAAKDGGVGKGELGTGGTGGVASDAGADGGGEFANGVADAGEPEGATLPSAHSLGSPAGSGGCAQAGGTEIPALALMALVGLARRRRAA